MCKRLPVPLWLCLLIVFLGVVVPAPGVRAASTIELVCNDQHLGLVAPSNRGQDFYFSYPVTSDADPSPWRVGYVEEDQGDIGMDIALVAETHFIDTANPANVIDATLHFHAAEYSAFGPQQGLQPYLPVVHNQAHGIPLPAPYGPPASSRVCTRLIVRHGHHNPIPMYMQLHLHGNEPPGDYRATLYGEAEFIGTP